MKTFLSFVAALLLPLVSSYSKASECETVHDAYFADRNDEFNLSYNWVYKTAVSGTYKIGKPADSFLQLSNKVLLLQDCNTDSKDGCSPEHSPTIALLTRLARCLRKSLKSLSSLTANASPSNPSYVASFNRS